VGGFEAHVEARKLAPEYKRWRSHLNHRRPAQAPGRPAKVTRPQTQPTAPLRRRCQEPHHAGTGARTDFESRKAV